MTKQEVKEYLSKEILGKIKDESAQKILRFVIFGTASTIDWEKVEYIIKRCRPELEN